MKYFEVASFGLTWLSCPTSFLLCAPYVVHLIAALLRPMLRRFAPYAAHVIWWFAPYATHAIRRFAPDASALTGQVRPSVNFPIQSSDGSFCWIGGVNVYNMEGWTHFFLMGLVQNWPHIHVHNVLPPSLEQMHHFFTIVFLCNTLHVVSPHCLKFQSFYPIFTQKPNNILLAINNSRTKYKRNSQRYRAHNLISHFSTNMMPIFGAIYFCKNNCPLHCLPTLFCLHHIQ